MNKRKQEQLENHKDRMSLMKRSSTEVIGLCNHVKEPKKVRKLYVDSIRFKKSIFNGVIFYDPNIDGIGRIPYGNRLINYTNKERKLKGQYRPQGGQLKATPGVKYLFDLKNSHLDSVDSSKKDIFFDYVKELFIDKPYLPTLFPSDITRMRIENGCYQFLYKFFSGKDWKPGGIHTSKDLPSDFAKDQVGDFFVGGPTQKRTADVNIVFRTINEIAKIFNNIITCKTRTYGIKDKSKLPTELLETLVGIDTIIESLPSDIKAFFCYNINKICQNHYYLNRSPEFAEMTNSKALYVYNSIKDKVKNKQISRVNLQRLSNLKEIKKTNSFYIKEIKNQIKKANGLVKLSVISINDLVSYYIKYCSDRPNMYKKGFNSIELTSSFKNKLMSIIKNKPENMLFNEIKKLINRYEHRLLEYIPAKSQDKVDIKGTAVPLKLLNIKKLHTQLGIVLKNHKDLKARKSLIVKILDIFLNKRLDITNELKIETICNRYIDRITFEDFFPVYRNYLLNNGKILTLVTKYKCLGLPNGIKQKFISNKDLRSTKNINEEKKLVYIEEGFKEYFKWLSKNCDLKVISIYKLFSNMMATGIQLYMDKTKTHLKHRHTVEAIRREIYKGAENRIKERIWLKKRKSKSKDEKNIIPVWYNKMWNIKKEQIKKRCDIKFELVTKILGEVAQVNNDIIPIYVRNMYEREATQLRC